jgi:integrase
MRGSIRKRGSTWTYYLFIRDPLTGGRRQRSKGGFRTKRECQAALTEALAAIRTGAFVEPSRRTVGSFLAEEWLPAVRRTNLRPSTWANYRIHIEAHVLPDLGGIELQQLSPIQLNALYQQLLTVGGRDGAGLAEKTVRNVHAILHRALKDAGRWGYLARNPAAAADPPTPKRLEPQVWEPAQLRTFLSHVRNDRLYAAWLLVATTGLRRGEILGLRWVDVDLKAGRLAVRQTLVVVDYHVQVSEPKTPRSRRALALDPATVEALRAHRTQQDGERALIGAGYHHSGLVFTAPDGSPIHPQRFSSWFEQHTRAAGLPRIRLHDVRHSYATAALAAGVPAKVVSERLGHATIAMTMDTYSHVLPALDTQAAAAVARLILESQQPDAEGPLTDG